MSFLRHISGDLKRSLLHLLLHPKVVETFSRLTASRVSIFMLHRFAAPDLGVTGHDPEALRRTLIYLRKHCYKIFSLQELVERLNDGEPLKKAVAFTIDDGYLDHYEIAAPVFAEFDCPVTTFLVSDFIDGKTWFWWDQLTYIFENTRRITLWARLGDDNIQYNLDSAEARMAANCNLSQRCKEASEQDRLECVAELSVEAEVHLPASPPARFAPLSWSQARSAEKRGMTFGPHTVTHPVLSTTSDAQSEFEITESVRRLYAELSEPAPIFCYPNGRGRDFGVREMETVRRLGLWGAVRASFGPLQPGDFRDFDTVRFQIPRYGYVDNQLYNLQCIAGLECAKSWIRRQAGDTGSPPRIPRPLPAPCLRTLSKASR